MTSITAAWSPSTVDISRPMPLDGSLPVSSIWTPDATSTPAGRADPGIDQRRLPLEQAGRIDQTRALWRIGSPYQDLTRAAVRIRAQKAAAQIGVPEPAVRSWAGRPWLAGGVGAGVAGGLAVAGQVPDLVAVAGVIGAAAGWAIERGVRGLRARRVRQQLCRRNAAGVRPGCGADHGPGPWRRGRRGARSRMAPGCCVWSRNPSTPRGCSQSRWSRSCSRWTSAVHRLPQARHRAGDHVARGAGCLRCEQGVGDGLRRAVAGLRVPGDNCCTPVRPKVRLLPKPSAGWTRWI